MPRTIGETSRRHGVHAHVLRHWEDVGALRTARSSSGHRLYGSTQDTHIELIKCGKIAGLSLEQMKVLLHGQADEREPILRQRLRELERAEQEVKAAKRLLEHVLSCESPGRCQECVHPHVSFNFPDSGDGASRETHP